MTDTTTLVTPEFLAEFDRLQDEHDEALQQEHVWRQKRDAARRAQYEMQNAIAAHGPWTVRSNHITDRRGRNAHRYVAHNSETGKDAGWKGGSIQRAAAEKDAFEHNRYWARDLIAAARKRAS